MAPKKTAKKKALKKKAATPKKARKKVPTKAAARKPAPKKAESKKTGPSVSAKRKPAAGKKAPARKAALKVVAAKPAAKKPAASVAPSSRKPPSRAGAARVAAAVPTASRAAAAPLRERTRSRQSIESDEDQPGLGYGSAGQSGDIQGLSSREVDDSESVEELVEEGQGWEAAAIQGVEDADSPNEVRTHEVPEDDVPEEYLHDGETDADD
jgi:hypothetical protein